MFSPDTVHVMLDIETLGTKPGSVVAAIGACVFEIGAVPDNAVSVLATFYERIDLADAQRCGLTIDAETVAWWMNQSAEARGDTFGGPRKALRSALSAFAEWLTRSRVRVSWAMNRKPLALWAKSPSFDCVLLEAAYDAVRMAPLPWTYRETFDVRTLLATSPPLATSMPAVEHNALADACAQAQDVRASWARLRCSA